MRRFGLRQPAALDDGAAWSHICHKCGAAIALDDRAIEARSIVEGALPALFHLGCAPAEDNLRWGARREIPVQVVRQESRSD